MMEIFLRRKGTTNLTNRFGFIIIRIRWIREIRGSSSPSDLVTAHPMTCVDIGARAGQFQCVNTMTILLGATFALLLAAVVLSFQGMNEGVKNAPADELARLRSQVDQLLTEQNRLKVAKELQLLRSNPAPEVSAPSDVEKMKAELAAKDAELAKLSEEKDDADKKAETYRDEAGLIGQRELEKNDNVLRRARLIRDALLIGRVSQFISDPETGNFAVIEVVLPEHVQSGTVLAIRRNTGILGKVEITNVNGNEAVGNPLPGFGPVIPEAGDELIIPPTI
jgi:hypothetical protein